MRKAGAKNYKDYSKEILKICKDKPISLEVFADNFLDIKKQAMQIKDWAKNVYVKVPVSNSKGKFMGKVIKELNNENIKLNITAVYSSKQTEKILKSINKKRLLFPLPLVLAKFNARLFEIMPKPLLTTDQLKLLKYDNVVSNKYKTNFDIKLDAKKKI